MKHGFSRLQTLASAKEQIKALISPLQAEEVSIQKALGRILAKDISAQIDVPHFEKSAMDGYAVKSADTFGATNTNPFALTLKNKIFIGQDDPCTIGKGECAEIVTGAPMPKGADAVLMVEYTEGKGGPITCYKAVAPGDNVIQVGSDCKKGELLYKKGHKLTPLSLGVISSQGISKVMVSNRPKISYFSTGNEIILPGSKLQKHKIFDINSIAITKLLENEQCDVYDLGVIDDDKHKIKEAINKGLERSDLLLFSGGSSLGGEDYMVEAVQEAGEVIIHGIAVKPGKPTLIGKAKGKVIIGLPGYPTSAVSNFFILVQPVLDMMTGHNRNLVRVKKRLSRKIASTIGRFQFLPIRIEGEIAVPIMKGSSAISTLARAEGYIEIDENTEVVEKGEHVEVILNG